RARVGAELADPEEALRRARLADLRDPFVDEAVAVVVETVARLRQHAGRHVRHADDATDARAHRDAARAQAEEAGHALQAAAGVALVDVAVAVVVEAVADLGRRLARHALRRAVHAVHLALLALAERDRHAIGAAAGVALVDEVVAVVVEAVADFRHRLAARPAGTARAGVAAIAAAARRAAR